MSLNLKELELHRQLLAAFDEYIRHNLRWEEKGHDVDGKRARKSLRKIIDTAYLRWKEIHNTRTNSDEPLVISNEFFREVVKKNSKISLTGKDNTST